MAIRPGRPASYGGIKTEPSSMMDNPHVLLSYLENDCGLHLEFRPNGTLNAGPKRRLTDDLQTLIRERKNDLIKALALRQRADSNGTEQSHSTDDSGKIIGVVIRLSVIAGQLTSLADSIHMIETKTAPKCREHPGGEIVYIDGAWFCGECIGLIDFNPAPALYAVGEEIAALSGALTLSRTLIDDLRRDLSATAESKEK
jgi:hypothetical protein